MFRAIHYTVVYLLIFFFEKGLYADITQMIFTLLFFFKELLYFYKWTNDFLMLGERPWNDLIVLLLS